MIILFIVTIGCVAGVWVNAIEPGVCSKNGLVEAIHTWWQELLTAILALIIAGTTNKDDKE